MKLKLLLITLCICTAGMSQDFIMKRKLADNYFNNFDFYKAAPMYEQLIKSNPDNRQLYEKLAAIYDHINDSRNAERCYTFLVSTRNPQPSELLNYARTLARNGKYDMAETWFRNYNSVQPKDPRGASFADACQNIRLFYRDSASFKIEKAPFSTLADEFCPVFYGKSIVFSSDRSKSSLVRSTYNWTNSSFLDLYIGDPVSGAAHPFSAELNSAFHDGPVCFNKTQDTIFITRSNVFNSRLIKSSEGVNKLGIFQAKWNPGTKKWMNLRALQFNNAEYSTEHPALSPEGDKLYFASDMPGGMGGMDLYVSCRNHSADSNTSWGVPVNLGPEINSPGNEVFPFADTQGNLWYASDGIPGQGGLDIFFAAKSPDGFAKAVNPGYPMNTRFDDFGFITFNAGKDGYLSSDRFNECGNDDIYKISRSFHKIVLCVTDTRTHKELSKVRILVKEDNGELSEFNNETGKPFTIGVNPYKSCQLSFTCDNYLPGNLVLSSEQLKEKDTLNVSLSSVRTVSEVNGIVFSAGDTPVAHATILMTNKSTSKIVEFVTDAGGLFKGEMEQDNEYIFKVVSNLKDGCHAESVEVTTRGIAPGTIINISMPVYCLGEIVRLDNIHYDLNDSKILPDAARILDRLVVMMNDYPKMKIELRSHTDSRGSAESNRLLSENRARKAIEYLLSKGILKNRISGKGYGDTMLLNKCRKGVQCSEEEHQQNRRTEFKILKWE